MYFFVDGQAFWAGIIGLGMVDEVFKEIKSAFDHLRNDMIRYGCRKEGILVHVS